MATRKSPKQRPGKIPTSSELVRVLERQGTKATKDGLVRFGIVAPNAFGVPMSAIQALAKRTGKDHALATASDPRNFVKKAVLWALRGVGGRSPALHDQATTLARRLGGSAEPAARFIGKGALRELTSATALRRLKARAAKKPAASRSKARKTSR